MVKRSIKNAIYVIVTIGMVVLSIVISIVVFKNVAKTRDDVSLTSEDGKVTFTFEKVTKGKTNWQPGQIGFSPVDMENFYSDYIENNEYYLYTLQVPDSQFNEVIYVMLKEEHYFYVKAGDLGVTLYDGLSACYTSERVYYFHLPYNNDLPSVGYEHILFEESLEISTYEDLLKYYGRLDESVYEAHDEEKVIFLSIHNDTAGGLIKNGAKLTVTETGFNVELMPEYVK